MLENSGTGLFRPQWPNLKIAVACFGFFGIFPRMKKARVIVKSVSSHHQIFVEHNGACAVTDKLPIAKDLVLKAKRELGIARGTRALFQAKSAK
jgi:hypothetical protein